MYILVRDVVKKCTEKSEGVKVYKRIRPGLRKNVSIRLDFDGVMNITEDFLYGLLGPVVEQNKSSYNQISYVRTKSHILTKFKGFSKKVERQDSRIGG